MKAYFNRPSFFIRDGNFLLFIGIDSCSASFKRWTLFSSNMGEQCGHQTTLLDGRLINRVTMPYHNIRKK